MKRYLDLAGLAKPRPALQDSLTLILQQSLKSFPGEYACGE